MFNLQKYWCVFFQDFRLQTVVGHFLGQKNATKEKSHSTRIVHFSPLGTKTCYFVRFQPAQGAATERAKITEPLLCLE